ncbi:MAG: folylpolyglutamate synthase/dihydrofolate synthase family protein [Vicinamibacterales bacterium]
MDPIQCLLDLERLGIKFGLQNIAALAGALGNPQDAFRSVIIAGTNGKGSVAAMVERGLRAAGLATGLYTSPHLVRLEERFVLSGLPVGTEVLREHAASVVEAARTLRASGALQSDPTFFEATTAAAFSLFRAARVDVAVLEVGLGGRFDATNIAEPFAGAITTIAFDHEALLGHTLAEIAFEKAGVVKPGMTVVTGELPDEAMAVVLAAGSERGARIVLSSEATRAHVSIEDGRTVLDLETPCRRYGALRLALRGKHQAANAIVATRLLEELSGCGIEVPGTAVVEALTSTVWRGRLELVDLVGRTVLVDSAHNPAGAEVLADYLRATHPEGLPLVFGAMRDKDISRMLSILLPSATHVVVAAPRTSRAADPAHIAAEARKEKTSVLVAGCVREALDLAWGFAPDIAVAGSIFLAGEALAAVDEMRGGGS